MTIPRRIRVDLATAPEVTIRAAKAAVEAMPADVRLTQASNKIDEALDLVSSYVDEQMQGVSIEDFPPVENKCAMSGCRRTRAPGLHHYCDAHRAV